MTATVLGLALYTALSTASGGVCRGRGAEPSGCVSVAFTPSQISQALIVVIGAVFVLLVRRIILSRADAGVPDAIASADQGEVRRLTTRAVIVLTAVPIVLVLVQHAGWLVIGLAGWQPGDLVQLPFFSHGTVSYRLP